jgi:hypothetical protein
MQCNEFQKFMNVQPDYLETEYLDMGCDTENSILSVLFQEL